MPVKMVKAAYPQVNQCCYCGRIGLDVNEYAGYHVGGHGEVAAFCCDDARACIQRVEQNKEDKGR